MKRTALVCYSSSDDEQPDEQVVKKRKLPSLPTSLIPAAYVNDPSLHQGRIRTTPHREGQFAAYVYVALSLRNNSPLRVFVDDVLSRAKQLVPTLHSIWDTGANGARREDEKARAVELRISLSRPTYLRAHQRDEFKRTVKTVATRHSSFEMSFATFAELTNDEHTRTFLTLEVGAGHDDFKRMSDALTPALTAIKQKEFYANPRFHASIGWALLDQPVDDGSTPRLSLTQSLKQTTSSDSCSSSPLPQNIFPTIPCFPPDLIPTLNKEFGHRLTSTNLGASGVDHVCLKIGNEVSKWRLLAI